MALSAKQKLELALKLTDDGDFTRAAQLAYGAAFSLAKRAMNRGKVADFWDTAKTPSACQKCGSTISLAENGRHRCLDCGNSWET